MLLAHGRSEAVDWDQQNSQAPDVPIAPPGRPNGSLRPDFFPSLWYECQKATVGNTAVRITRARHLAVVEAGSPCDGLIGRVDGQKG